ncbi:hypothetical protein F5141DRAFT_1208818 [Pisolithus sp. B1]|nr:hypothetical protein F5141DRAFT_1208818 [Pisolithus sp. B1]
MGAKILVLGSGGREHALSWKLAQSDLVEHIYVCPGNGGTAANPKTTNLSLPLTPPYQELVCFASSERVLPGPEEPLVLGVEKHFRKGPSLPLTPRNAEHQANRAVGVPVFGPSELAARMEGSIPTAKFRTFSSGQIDDAIDYVRNCGFRVVLKASGLAAGKGVLIPGSVDEAVEGLQQIMVANVFGAAGDQVVIEELLEGPEISVLAFSDGYTVVPLPAAQDHKRIGEGDTVVMDRIVRETLRPTIDGMRKEGFPFVGLLFTGFMLTDSGPRVLEYNVRFGDPETEALMLLLDADLACDPLERRLDSVQISAHRAFSVSVVLVSGGYPGPYPKGKQIEIGDIPSGVVVFQCGTATAPTLEEALALAYTACDKISFEGMAYRRDIAHRALAASKHTAKGLTYADAGVSVDAGNALVTAIKPYVHSTRRPGSDAEIGGFGGIFDLKATGYDDPVLVAGTDGVGTKLHIAIEVGLHDTVGIDLVAMSVNDLLVQGAEPLLFLDYYGCSKLDVTTAAEVVKGIAQGCQEAGCALIGGETAEMPGMYRDYDLAGFAVGAVERHLILPRQDIAPGDVLLGIASSGLHSNGFSLVRKIVSLSGLSYSSPCPWDENISLGKHLLEPTRIYVKQVLPAAKAGVLKGMSHITGGGFIENIPRVLPQALGCYIDASAWPLPPVFRFLMQHGGVEPLQMARTFNNGIGLIVIVDKDQVEKTLDLLHQDSNVPIYKVGEVTEKSGVEMRNLKYWATH